MSPASAWALRNWRKPHAHDLAGALAAFQRVPGPPAEVFFAAPWRQRAASVFTGAGPGATLAVNASTPPLANALRHRRTVSSRTPRASSATRGLVQPDSVSKIARA